MLDFLTKFTGSHFSGYLSILSVISVLGLVYYIYNEGKEACVSEQSRAVIEEVRSNERKKNEVGRLDDDELIERYCRWVFDVPYDECLKTVTYVE